MTFNYELFTELSKSEVFLEDSQHVYIHKKTKERFLSVTTVLNLIKHKLDKQPIQTGLTKQYETFFEWADAIHLPPYKIPRFLHLYVNYKNFRPYVIKQNYKGEEYKAYKKLNKYEYPTFLHFEREFNDLENQHKHLIAKFKNIYLNSQGQIMTKKEMDVFWQDITDIANIYGTMIHEIVEQYILLKQYFINHNPQIEQDIYNNFLLLKEKNRIFAEKYKYSHHTFEEYVINTEYKDFKEHVISSFLSLKPNLGRICVPEKILYYPKYKLCGTQDVYVDLSPSAFDIGDHKTNKEFTYESEYALTLKRPFNHLDQSDLNLYNLQLSTYALMNEATLGKKLNNLWISYYNRSTHSFQKIDLNPLKEEAQELLELFKKHTETRHALYLKNGILDDVPDIFHNHLIKGIDDYVEQLKEQGKLSENKDKNRELIVEYKKQYLIRQEKLNV